MESDRIKVYKYCLVPMCTNTIKTAPNKLFFLVPRIADIRIKWCKVMKRDEIKNPKLSATTALYVCEDHFDLEKDTANFIRYQVMTVQEGIPVSLRLKRDVLPHKFECQKQKKPVTERTVLKRQKLMLVQEAMQVSAEADLCKQNTDSSTSEISCCETGPGASVQSTLNINSEKHACVHHSLIPFIDEVIIKACGIINMQDVLIKK